MKQSIHIKGTVFSLETPRVMGILNVTPDSFSDGGKYRSVDAALLQAKKMIAEGVDIIDVGGYSSRPGAAEVSIHEELDRVIPVLERLSIELDVVLSIDTFRAVVAKQAIEAGAHIVNDISAGDDDVTMIPTVAELGVPYIAMHKKGLPQSMQDNPQYGDVVAEVYDYLKQKKKQCVDAGIHDVILDLGYGFGKTLEHNYELLRRLTEFQEIGAPILTGVSRKSMVFRALGINASEALNGTT
ncbi:MAG TPA: dihydropteroate synthase, partial [Bacteroidetes bacterium]|nr:dihydropteroate synthase [Bacteroidota bacterium]